MILIPELVAIAVFATLFRGGVRALAIALTLISLAVDVAALTQPPPQPAQTIQVVK